MGERRIPWFHIIIPPGDIGLKQPAARKKGHRTVASPGHRLPSAGEDQFGVPFEAGTGGRRRRRWPSYGEAVLI